MPLVEAVIHGYDIAWPLARTLKVPAPSLLLVAETCRRTGLFLGSKQRCAGLALYASDAWSAGSGPQVTGPLASIIMVITGWRNITCLPVTGSCRVELTT